MVTRCTRRGLSFGMMSTVRVSACRDQQPIDSATGLDMSVMAGSIYDEAIVDVVGPQSLLSEPAVVKVKCPLFHNYGHISHPTGPLPRRHHPRPTRLRLHLPTGRHQRQAHQSPRPRALLRHLLLHHTRTHPSRNQGLDCQTRGWRCRRRIPSRSSSVKEI